MMTISFNLLTIDALANVKVSFSKYAAKKFLAMEFDGGVKLPQIKTDVAVTKKVPNTLQELGTSGSHALFRSPPALGAGTDERFSTSFVNGRLEDQAALLTKVHMSFMQHSLLTDLMSDKYGMVEKLHKVQYASREQLLGSSYDYQWQPTSAHAGGLMNDWSFNME